MNRTTTLLRDYHSRRSIIKFIFAAVAIAIAVVSLLVSNRLAKHLQEEERLKMETWAEALQMMAADDGSADMNLVLRVLQSNTSIPAILVDSISGQLSAINIETPTANSNQYLQEKTQTFAKKHDPIKLKDLDQYVYYDDSTTLKRLQRYPLIQLSVMALFVALAFATLISAKRAEQNRVWAGLSKETAHQLGTPISALIAWVEYLKSKPIDPDILTEINKDIARLETIADRFSKIGTHPNPQTHQLQQLVANAVSYLEKRISKHILIQYHFPPQPVLVNVNETLFDWVIENLTKNAIDAMSGQGTITYTITTKGKHVCLDISDTGKGIPKSKQKTIFSPGYTTKERGWGLGLALARRIIRMHPHGRIFVKSSDPEKGTTFRIVMSCVSLRS